MRISTLRRLTAFRALALVALVTLWATAGGWTHMAWDDVACDPIPIVHDASAHRFTGDTRPSPDPDGHCFLCHTLRVLHFSRATGAVVVSHVLTAALLGADRDAAFIRESRRSIPSRAPPAVLL